MIVRLPPHALAMLCSHLHKNCHLCGESITHHTHRNQGVFSNTPLLCEFCQASIQTGLPIFKIETPSLTLPLYVASFYQAPLNRVMANFKDHEDLSALMVLYWTMFRLVAPRRLNASNAIIVPIPTTDGRLIKRGFNPVLTLAKFLSYHWQIPLWQGTARHENDTHQRGLDKSARLQNVKQDFYLTDVPRVRHVIIFDDVITTGATVSAVADVLLKENPKLTILVVGVLHGKVDLHLPKYF